MKKLNSKLLVAALGVGLAVTTTVGSTYAWWTVNTTATVSGVNMEATKTGEAVFLKTDKTGTFRDSLDLSEKFDKAFTPATTCDAVNYYKLSEAKFNREYEDVTETTPAAGTRYFEKTNTGSVQEPVYSYKEVENLSAFATGKAYAKIKKDYFDYETISNPVGSISGGSEYYYYLSIPVYVAMSADTKSVSISATFDATGKSSVLKAARYSVSSYHNDIYTQCTDSSTYESTATYATYNSETKVYTDGTVEETTFDASKTTYYKKTPAGMGTASIYGLVARTAADSNSDGIDDADTALNSFNSTHSTLIAEKGETLSSKQAIAGFTSDATQYDKVTTLVGGTQVVVNSASKLTKTQMDALSDGHLLKGLTQVEDASYCYSMFTINFWIEGNDCYCYNDLAGQTFDGLSFDVTASTTE